MKMSISVQGAERREGLATLRKYGSEHYIRISTKGQMTLRKKYPDIAKERGKMGGRSPKSILNEIEGGGIIFRRKADPHL